MLSRSLLLSVRWAPLRSAGAALSTELCKSDAKGSVSPAGWTGGCRASQCWSRSSVGLFALSKSRRHLQSQPRLPPSAQPHCTAPEITHRSLTGRLLTKGQEAAELCSVPLSSHNPPRSLTAHLFKHHHCSNSSFHQLFENALSFAHLKAFGV